MRSLVSMLGLVTALVLVAPAFHPAPAHAADAQTTVTTDNWKGIAEIIKKLWLEAYMLIDRLLDGTRNGGDGGCCCGGTACPCCGGGGGTGGSGTGGTGGGGTGGTGTGGGTLPGGG